MNDQDSDDVADGRFSDSEADRDRLMISYTEHFDPTTAYTSDDIREELEEEVEEDGMLPISVLPESQQGEEGNYFIEELESSMEVRHFVQHLLVLVIINNKTRSPQGLRVNSP